jgi:putative transposase
MSSSQFVLRLATEPVVVSTIEQVPRAGARMALQKAIEYEVAEYINSPMAEVDQAGRRLVVRNGHKPMRTILTGVGPLEVKQPRVDDRRVDENGVKFQFTSKILPPYLRKTEAIADLVPWLYLKGISTGQMSDALVHLGFDGTGSSATTVTRMTEVWQGEYDVWNRRDLTGKRYVYAWADGISTVRLRTYRTKGPGSRKAALAMAFKLTLKAEGSWRKLNGAKKLQELIDGTVFVDGIQKAA